MNGFFDYMFGENGNATAFFGGEWWIVGIFVILLFCLYLYQNRVSPQGIAIFLLSAFLYVTVDGLFSIPQSYIVTIVLFIIIFVAMYFYSFVNR
jgi:hypothetical protein